MNDTGTGAVRPSRNLKMKMSVAVLAGAGVLSSASVWAQDAQVAAEQQASAATTVVVTGVRRAAQSAQAIKRNSDEVIDSIVA